MEGLIFGRYRVTGRIGQGGMADVWGAVHETTGREAVVKVLLPEMSRREQLVRRFLQEAKAAARIRHAGSVDVLDVGYGQDGRAYLVLEKLEGETLSARLSHTPSVSIAHATRWIRQLTRAMKAAHDAGIVHRDLKPDNLFLVPDAEVAGGERMKVLDFGLAKLVESVGSVRTMQGTVFGTPSYMAPEQCRDSGQVDARADLYSIGCILYCCLCGEPPFGKGSSIEVLRAQLYDRPPPPRQRRAEIPAALDALILLLLEKDPSERFASCDELLTALDRAEGAVPVAVVDDDDDDETRPFSHDRDLPDLLRAAPNEATIVELNPDALLEDLPHARGDGLEAPAEPTIVTPSGDAPGQDNGSVPSVSGVELYARVQRAHAPRTRKLFWIMTGLVALCAALIVVTVALGAVGEPIDGEERRGDRPEVVALAAAERALAGREWRTAIDETTRVLDGLRAASGMNQHAAELRERAAELREHAASEQANQRRMTRVREDAAAGHIARAIASAREFTEPSVYREPSAELVARMREAWLAERRAEAQALIERGACAQLDEFLRDALDEVPDAASELADYSTACRDRTAQLAQQRQRQLEALRAAVHQLVRDSRYDQAPALCQRNLSLLRGDVDLASLCVIAACRIRDAATATRLARVLPADSRTGALQRCVQHGVRAQTP